MTFRDAFDSYMGKVEALDGRFDDLIPSLQAAVEEHMLYTRAETILLLEDLLHMIISVKVLFGDARINEQYVRRRLQGYIRDDVRLLLKRAKKVQDPKSRSIGDTMELFGRLMLRDEMHGDEESE